MLWIILRMLTIGSLTGPWADISASVTRALGGAAQPGGAIPPGVQPARADAATAVPRVEPFTPGLRLAPPPAKPATPLPRGSLLDLSV